MIERTAGAVGPTTLPIDYRHLAEALPAMVAVSEPDGALSYVNQRWLDYTGLSFSELNEDRSRFVHPADLAPVADARDRAVRSGQPIEVDYRVRRYDGEYRWHLWRAVPIRDAQGHIARWFGTATDVHDRKQAEDQARLSEARYRVLAETLPGIVVMANPQGELEYFNGRWTEYTGLSPEDSSRLTADDISTFFHPDDWPEVQRLWRGAVEQGDSYRVEFRLRRHDGLYRWFLGQVQPLLDSTGRITSFVSTSIDIDDRRQTESLLRQSEERFRQVIETANEGVWIIDPGTRTTYVNDRMAAMLGYARDEMMGRRLFDFTDADGRAMLQSKLHQRREGKTDQYDFRFIRKDGSELWVIIHGAPLVNEDGSFVGSFAMITDVTERRQQTAALTASEERYRQLAESVPALITLSDARGTIQYCNQQLIDYSGMTREQIFAGEWRNLYHPDDVTEHMPGWTERLGRGETLEGEVRLRRHDGSYRWQLGRIAPVKDASGQITAWIGAHIDIDDRKRAELTQQVLDSLGESLSATLNYEETVRSMVDCCVPSFADFAAVYMRDEDGSIQRTAVSSADPRHTEIVGFQLNPQARSGAAAVMQSGVAELYETVTEDLLRDAATSPEHLQALLSMGFTSAIIVPIPARAGVLGAMSFSTTRSRRRYGKHDLGLAQEIARRGGLAIENARLYREAQVTLNELRRANAAKDEFLGLVSHELKTPITTIYGNAEVLQRRGREVDEELRRTAIADMGREAERLHRIVDNLLVLARLERGQRIDAEPLLVRRIAERLIEEHRQRFPFRKVDLNADAPLTPVNAEPLYVEQVLRNLLSNAEKYSPWDRRIEVRVERTEGELRVSVLDRGPGFEDEEAERIFTPFYRSPRTSNRAGGVGIGLAVCKRLVEVQGGRVWARPRPDGGADIGFALPATPEAMAE